MNLSESVYMVINQLMPDIRKTKKTIDLLEKLNFDMDKISLVINRFFDNHPDLGLEDVQRLLSRRVDHTVANDWMSVSDSINQGILLSQGRRKSQVREDLERIAEQKVDTVVPVEKKGFLSSMLGKKDGLSGNGINAA